jgi:hypothetical protein
MASEAHLGAKLEPPGVDLRWVVAAGCGAILLVLGAVAMLAAVYHSQVANGPLPPPRSFPQPRVQPDEADELHRLMSEQRARLTGYAWADKQKGFVRVPIDRAMQLIVQAGSKAYDPVAPSATALSSPTAGAQRATPGSVNPPAANGGGPPVDAPEPKQ